MHAYIGNLTVVMHAGGVAGNVGEPQPKQATDLLQQLLGFGQGVAWAPEER